MGESVGVPLLFMRTPSLFTRMAALFTRLPMFFTRTAELFVRISTLFLRRGSRLTKAATHFPRHDNALSGCSSDKKSMRPLHKMSLPSMISPNSPPSCPVRKSFQFFSVQYSENSPCLCGAGREEVLSFKFVCFKSKKPSSPSCPSCKSCNPVKKFPNSVNPANPV